MIDFSRKLGQLTIGRRPVASLKIGGKDVWSSPLSPEARDPANGGIELSGEYKDGTTFSFLINALDNSI